MNLKIFSFFYCKDSGRTDKGSKNAVYKECNRCCFIYFETFIAVNRYICSNKGLWNIEEEKN